jgi:hypothetical protein
MRTFDIMKTYFLISGSQVVRYPFETVLHVRETR